MKNIKIQKEILLIVFFLSFIVILAFLFKTFHRSDFINPNYSGLMLEMNLMSKSVDNLSTAIIQTIKSGGRSKLKKSKQALVSQKKKSLGDLKDLEKKISKLDPKKPVRRQLEKKLSKIKESIEHIKKAVSEMKKLKEYDSIDPIVDELKQAKENLK